MDNITLKNIPRLKYKKILELIGRNHAQNEIINFHVWDFKQNAIWDLINSTCNTIVEFIQYSTCSTNHPTYILLCKQWMLMSTSTYLDSSRKPLHILNHNIDLKGDNLHQILFGVSEKDLIHCFEPFLLRVLSVF